MLPAVSRTPRPLPQPGDPGYDSGYETDPDRP